MIDFSYKLYCAYMKIMIIEMPIPSAPPLSSQESTHKSSSATLIENNSHWVLPTVIIAAFVMAVYFYVIKHA